MYGVLLPFIPVAINPNNLEVNAVGNATKIKKNISIVQEREIVSVS